MQHNTTGSASLPKGAAPTIPAASERSPTAPLMNDQEAQEQARILNALAMQQAAGLTHDSPTSFRAADPSPPFRSEFLGESGAIHTLLPVSAREQLAQSVTNGKTTPRPEQELDDPQQRMAAADSKSNGHTRITIHTELATSKDEEKRQENKEDEISTARKYFYRGAAFLTPITFALQAAATRLPHPSLNESSLDEFCALSAGEKFFSSSLGASSYVTNVLSNLEQIPKTFKNASERFGSWSHFRQDLLKNTVILALASGAGLSLGTLGVGSLAWVGGWASGWVPAANGMFFGFLSFVSRLNNLDILDKKIMKHFTQGDYENLLERLANDPKALDFLATQYTDAINKIMQQDGYSNKIDAKKVYYLLEQVFDALKHHADFQISEKSCGKKFLALLNWAFAVSMACSIAPMFAAKFLKGIGAIETTFAGWLNYSSSAIDNSQSLIKDILGYLFSSATPIMYLSASSRFAQILKDAYKSIRNPHYTKEQRAKAIGTAILVTGTGALACSSGYNLVQGYYNNDMDSVGNKTHGVAASIGVFCTNGAFTYSDKWFPPSPDDHPIKPTPHRSSVTTSRTPLLAEEQKASDTVIDISREDQAAIQENIFNFCKKSAEYLEKNRLSDEAVSALNLRKQELAHIKTYNLPSDAARMELKTPAFFSRAEQPKPSTPAPTPRSSSRFYGFFRRFIGATPKQSPINSETGSYEPPTPSAPPYGYGSDENV